MKATKVNPKVFQDPSTDFLQQIPFIQQRYNQVRLEFLENFSSDEQKSRIIRIKYALLIRLMRCIELNEKFHWSKRLHKIKKLQSLINKNQK